MGKSGSVRTTSYGILPPCQNSEKLIKHFQKNTQADGRMEGQTEGRTEGVKNGQTLFYRTLLEMQSYLKVTMYSDLQK